MLGRTRLGYEHQHDMTVIMTDEEEEFHTGWRFTS